MCSENVQEFTGEHSCRRAISIKLQSMFSYRLCLVVTLNFFRLRTEDRDIQTIAIFSHKIHFTCLFYAVQAYRASSLPRALSKYFDKFCIKTFESYHKKCQA